jgi:hypothetical protein
MPKRGLTRTEAKREYNVREKQSYHKYRKIHGPLKGGQKGFRVLIRRLPIAQRPLSLLSPRQKIKRDAALHVLARSRRFGESFTKTARAARISPKTVLRYLGRSGFRKVKGRWKPTHSDSLLRRMVFFEEGQIKGAIVRGSKTASLIGKYDRDVRTFLEDPARDPSILKKWKGRKFKDAAGNLHTFETDPHKIREAVERADIEPEIFETNSGSEEIGEAVDDL